MPRLSRNKRFSKSNRKLRVSKRNKRSSLNKKSKKTTGNRRKARVGRRNVGCCVTINRNNGNVSRQRQTKKSNCYSRGSLTRYWESPCAI